MIPRLSLRVFDPAHVTGALRRAADHYDRLWRLLDTKRELAPFPWQITPERLWTAAMRRAHAALLEGARAHERSALAQIEAVLALQ